MAAFELRTFAWIALGGALGAVSRFLVGILFIDQFGLSALAGSAATLFVNVIGSFAMGWIASMHHDPLSSTYIGATVGFLGAFTTFAAFSFETLRFIQKGNFFNAASYVLLSVFLCLSGAYLGFRLGKG